MSPFANAMSDAEVFWSKVDRTGECWLWKGATDAHGYGKVVVDQEMMRANHVAWFLVMGAFPSEPLYRKCPGSLDRRCVRPHHMRLGAPDRAISRWKADAQEGFPPEFRSAVADLMPTAQAQDELVPLLLYRGGLTPGRAQAMFNFTVLAQQAEATRLGDVVEMSRRWPDMSHAVGLHKPFTTPSTPGQFWSRLLQHPKITDTRPGMREYIRETLAASRYRPISLDPIARYSQWSTRRWRSGRRTMAEIRLASVERKRQVALNAAPLPEYWPFLSTAPTTEHDLVTSVDAVVPKGIPEWLRQDVCQDLILAVLEGRTTVENLRDASPDAIKAVFRMYPTKYGPLSLDAKRGGEDDDERTLLDSVADGPLILGNADLGLAELRERLRSQEVLGLVG